MYWNKNRICSYHNFYTISIRTNRLVWNKHPEKERKWRIEVHWSTREPINLKRLASVNASRDRLFASRFSLTLISPFLLLFSSFLLSFLFLHPFDRPTNGSSICSSWFEFFPADRPDDEPAIWNSIRNT